MNVNNNEIIEKVELLKSLRVVKKDVEIAQAIDFPASVLSSYLSKRDHKASNHYPPMV